jgi:hypothetical protein
MVEGKAQLGQQNTTVLPLAAAASISFSAFVKGRTPK